MLGRCKGIFFSKQCEKCEVNTRRNEVVAACLTTVSVLRGFGKSDQIIKILLRMIILMYNLKIITIEKKIIITKVDLNISFTRKNFNFSFLSRSQFSFRV